MHGSDSIALRAFTVLEYVVKAEGPVSLDETTKACNLPKPTTYRILGMLQRNGLLQREAIGKRYSAGLRVTNFAYDVLQSSNLRAQRNAILARLVNEIGETCNFTMLDGQDVLYLDRIETSMPLRLHVDPGVRLPLYCTASGKLFLSQMSSKQVLRLVGRPPLKRYTERTIVDFRVLEKELKRIRTQRFSTDNREYENDSVCIAVPVADPQERVWAAIAVHGPSTRMTVKKSLEFLPAMRRAAESFAKTLKPEPPEATLQETAVPRAGISKSRAGKKLSRVKRS